MAMSDRDLERMDMTPALREIENRIVRDDRERLLLANMRLQEENTALKMRELRLEEALRRIEKWKGEFPDTGRTWDDGTPMSYSAVYGSNGERDYMRAIARRALAPEGVVNLYC